jgi:hypothetical protein
MSEMPDYYNEVVAVANATMATERLTDRTILSLAALIQEATAQAEKIKLTPHETQPAFDALQSAMNHAFEARRSVVALHTQFGLIGRQLGATHAEWGDPFPCPNPKTSASKRDVRRLRAAAIAAAA